MCTGGESNQGPLGPKSDALSTAPLRLSIPIRERTKSICKRRILLLERLVTSGIPQGNVIGLVLFPVFINYLPDVTEVLIKLFADDAKIYAVVSN